MQENTRVPMFLVAFDVDVDVDVDIDIFGVSIPGRE